MGESIAIPLWIAEEFRLMNAQSIVASNYQMSHSPSNHHSPGNFQFHDPTLHQPPPHFLFQPIHPPPDLSPPSPPYSKPTVSLPYTNPPYTPFTQYTNMAYTNPPGANSSSPQPQPFVSFPYTQPHNSYYQPNTNQFHHPYTVNPYYQEPLSNARYTLPYYPEYQSCSTPLFSSIPNQTPTTIMEFEERDQVRTIVEKKLGLFFDPVDWCVHFDEIMGMLLERYPELRDNLSSPSPSPPSPTQMPQVFVEIPLRGVDSCEEHIGPGKTEVLQGEEHEFEHPIEEIESPVASTNYNSVNDNGSTKVTQKKFETLYEGTLVFVIDRKMKEHTDNLMHAVEGLSTRLSQLDCRKCYLENSLDELKESVEYSHKSTDGKLRQLENMLREVQGGVLDLRDKQEIAEAQLQLAMLQVSKCDPQSEKQNKSAGTHLVQLKSSSASKDSHKSLPNPVTFPQPFPALPPNAPRNPPYENSELPPAAAQRPTQIFQNEMPSLPRPECYPPSREPTHETAHEEYYRTPTQQSRPAPPAPHQLYPLAFQFPQMQQSIQQHLVHSPPSTGSPQAHPPMDHQAEGSSYISSQSYHQGIHQTYSQPPGGAPPTPQFYMSFTQKLHDQALNMPSSKFIPGYPPPGGYTSSSDYNPHTESPPFYVSSGARPSYPVHPSSVPSGDNSYPQLPTAKILPHALPTASSMSGGSGSSETGNRVPVDDVVGKVSAMGFRRDQVRAMVKKLTDNGQAVDLNVVLDKLMNNG